MDDDMVTGKGEPNGFWEYGGCCLGNRCTGRTVAYVMSQASEVLVPTGGVPFTRKGPLAGSSSWGIILIWYRKTSEDTGAKELC